MFIKHLLYFVFVLLSLVSFCLLKPLLIKYFISCSLLRCFIKLSNLFIFSLLIVVMLFLCFKLWHKYALRRRCSWISVYQLNHFRLLWLIRFLFLVGKWTLRYCDYLPYCFLKILKKFLNRFIPKPLNYRVHTWCALTFIFINNLDFLGLKVWFQQIWKFGLSIYLYWQEIRFMLTQLF